MEPILVFLGQVVAFWAVWKVLDHTVPPVIRRLKFKPKPKHKASNVLALFPDDDFIAVPIDEEINYNDFVVTPLKQAK